MTWTYDATKLPPSPDASADLYATRLLIGDVDSTDQQLQDEEINYLKLQEPTGDDLLAAARCADAVAARYARLVNTTIGDLSRQAAEKHKHFLDLAERLREAAYSAVSPLFPAKSQTAKQGYEDDTDRVQPKFGRETGSYPESGTPPFTTALPGT